MKVVTRSRFGIWISILLGRFLCAFDFLLFHPKTSPSPHGVTYILRPLPVNCPTGADFAKGSSGATLASHQRHRHDAPLGTWCVGNSSRIEDENLRKQSIQWRNIPSEGGATLPSRHLYTAFGCWMMVSHFQVKAACVYQCMLLIIIMCESRRECQPSYSEPKKLELVPSGSHVFLTRLATTVRCQGFPLVFHSTKG